MSINELPPELFLQIVSKLPGVDKQCLRLVCRGFKRLLLTPLPHPLVFTCLNDSAIELIDLRRRLLRPDNVFALLPGENDVCAVCFRITPRERLISGLSIHEKQYAVCGVCGVTLLEKFLPVSYTGERKVEYRHSDEQPLPQRANHMHRCTTWTCGNRDNDKSEPVRGGVLVAGDKPLCVKYCMRVFSSLIPRGQTVTYGGYSMGLCKDCGGPCGDNDIHRHKIGNGGDGEDENRAVFCELCHRDVCKDEGCDGWPEKIST